jgi:hypothetical protein
LSRLRAKGILAIVEDNSDDPWALDWGQGTVEVFQAEKKIALHVINHDLTSSENRSRTLRFLHARIRWFASNLPQGSVQAVRFDDRGQKLASGLRQEIKAELGPLVTSVAFMSETGG